MDIYISAFFIYCTVRWKVTDTQQGNAFKAEKISFILSLILITVIPVPI